MYIISRWFIPFCSTFQREKQFMEYGGSPMLRLKEKP